jgi:two-component system response regulator HydG
VRQARVLPLFGPVLVLYLIADAASEASGLGLGGWAVALSALAASILPLLPRWRGTAGARRVQLLGVGLALSLLPLLSTTLGLTVARIWGLTAASVLILDLSLNVPDAPRMLDRGPLGRALPVILALVVGALATFAVLPAEAAGDVLMPARWADAPDHLLLASLLVALAIRLSRRSLGSGPEALARNAWPVFGLSLALMATVADRVIWASSFPVSPTLVRGLPVITVLALVTSHVFLVDERRALRAGGTIRRAMTWTSTLAAVGALGSLASYWIDVPPLELALGAMLLFAVGILAQQMLSRVIDRTFAPFSGRLLDAADESSRRLGPVKSVIDLGRALLPPLRIASGSDDAMPLLYTVDPALEVRVDRAGEAHVRSQPMPEPLRDRLVERPGEALVKKALDGLVVRRPALRGVVEALNALDALVVVPLSIDGELEGAIVVPRGRRRSAPTLEELRALERVADRCAGMVALLSAERRAQGRAGHGDQQKHDLEDRIEVLEEERDRLRAEARSWKAGRPAHRMSGTTVAYSAAMRSLMERVADVAVLDAPVLLLAESGAAVDQVAHAIHERSGRKDGPLVVADCASLREDRAAAALFGEVDGDDTGVVRPGWLSLARGGSLLLADVVALPLSVQHDLAESLAEREIRPIGSAGAEPIDVRVIATSRVDLELLALDGVFDPELARWLEPLALEVPPLRSRREDIPSLTLLALDRACRLLGREPMGIDEDALDVLRQHDFPGNVRELTWLITRAVGGAEDSNVTLADLPPLARPEPESEIDETHPLDGTWAELEKRILVRALDAAEGNKSEAARALGLKRTTFLDKLRRHELAPPAKQRRSEAPALS